MVDLGARARRGRVAHDESVAARAADRGRVGRGRGPPPERAVGPVVRHVLAVRRARSSSCACCCRCSSVSGFPGTCCSRCPQVDLPSWAAGVTLGGPVTLGVARRRVQRGPAARDAARVRRRREQPRQPVPAAARGAVGAVRARRRRHRRAVVRAADGRRRPPACATRAGCAAARTRAARHARARGAGARRRARTVARPRGVDGQPRLRAARRPSPASRRRAGQATTLVGAGRDHRRRLRRARQRRARSCSASRCSRSARSCSRRACTSRATSAAPVAVPARPVAMPEWLTVAAGVGALAALVVAGRLGVEGCSPRTARWRRRRCRCCPRSVCSSPRCPRSQRRPSRGADARDDHVRRHVTFTYPDAPQPALVDVDLTIDEGEFFLVVGETGAGKSTLLRAVNGLVPHFTGGTLLGRVAVDGISTVDAAARARRPRRRRRPEPDRGLRHRHRRGRARVRDGEPRRRARRHAPPRRGRARPARHRAPAAPLARRRCRRARRSASRSARCSPRRRACSCSTSRRRRSIPGAAEDVLAILTRLVDDLGLTVLLAEHRLERVVQYATRVARRRRRLPGPRRSTRRRDGARAGRAAGRRARRALAGWTPVPLSVRDAAPRRRPVARPSRRARAAARAPCPRPARRSRALTGVGARYGPVEVLHDIDLALRAARSSRSWAATARGSRRCSRLLAGLTRPAAGRVTVAGREPHTLHSSALVRQRRARPVRSRRRCCTRRTVDDECAVADHEHGLPAGTTRATLDRIEPGLDPAASSPRLLRGQRLALALAVVLAPGAAARSCSTSRRAASTTRPRRASPRCCASSRRAGHAVVLATHDVELVAEAATRAVVIADGEIVADGPAREVVCHSPVFAPQIAKVLAPGRVAHRRRSRGRARVMTARRDAGAIRFRWRSGALLAATSVARPRRVHVAAVHPPARHREPRARRRRAVVLHRCSCRCSSASCSPSSPTARSTPRRSRCSACSSRAAPRCARRAPA